MIKDPEFFSAIPRTGFFLAKYISFETQDDLSADHGKKLLIVLISNLIESLNYPTVRFINPDVCNQVDYSRW